MMFLINSFEGNLRGSSYKEMNTNSPIIFINLEYFNYNSSGQAGQHFKTASEGDSTEMVAQFF